MYCTLNYESFLFIREYKASGYCVIVESMYTPNKEDYQIKNISNKTKKEKVQLDRLLMRERSLKSKCCMSRDE